MSVKLRSLIFVSVMDANRKCTWPDTSRPPPGYPGVTPTFQVLYDHQRFVVNIFGSSQQYLLSIHSNISFKARYLVFLFQVQGTKPFMHNAYSAPGNVSPKVVQDTLVIPQILGRQQAVIGNCLTRLQRLIFNHYLPAHLQDVTIPQILSHHQTVIHNCLTWLQRLIFNHHLPALLQALWHLQTVIHNCPTSLQRPIFNHHLPALLQNLTIPQILELQETVIHYCPIWLRRPIFNHLMALLQALRTVSCHLLLATLRHLQM